MVLLSIIGVIIQYSHYYLGIKVCFYVVVMLFYLVPLRVPLSPLCSEWSPALFQALRQTSGDFPPLQQMACGPLLCDGSGAVSTWDLLFNAHVETGRLAAKITCVRHEVDSYTHKFEEEEETRRMRISLRERGTVTIPKPTVSETNILEFHSCSDWKRGLTVYRAFLKWQESSLIHELLQPSIFFWLHQPNQKYEQQLMIRLQLSAEALDHLAAKDRVTKCFFS